MPLADLLRQSVYSRLAGHEDVDDAERFSLGPAFRPIGSRKIWERGAALISRLQSFETEVLTQEGNLAGLAALNRELLGRTQAIASPRRGKEVVFRADAAFAKPELYEALEERGEVRPPPSCRGADFGEQGAGRSVRRIDGKNGISGCARRTRNRPSSRRRWKHRGPKPG